MKTNTVFHVTNEDMFVQPCDSRLFGSKFASQKLFIRRHYLFVGKTLSSIDLSYSRTIIPLSRDAFVYIVIQRLIKQLQQII